MGKVVCAFIFFFGFGLICGEKVLSEEYWTNIVTSKPDSYVETYDSAYIIKDGYLQLNMTPLIYINDESAFAWFLSVANGLNGNTATVFDSTTVIHITSDLDMSAYEWTPIKNFYGTLEGNNHVIFGIKIENVVKTGTFTYLGLFGISHGSIRNLHFKESYVNALYQGFIGSFVGYNYGLIQNCSNSGIVKGESSDAGYYMGGICGHNGGLVSDCSNSGTVYFDYGNCKNNIDYQSTGGIAGRSYTRISNCINYADVTGCCCVGGIAGQGGKSDVVSIVNCVNRGIIRGSGSYIGGIAGVAMNIFNSYNIGKVIKGGGLFGYMAGGTVANCYIASANHYQYGSGYQTYSHLYWDSDSITIGNTLSKELVSFSVQDDSCVLSASVYSTNSLVKALNAWVKEQNDTIYKTWSEDTASVNNGYPIFGSLFQMENVLSFNFESLEDDSCGKNVRFSPNLSTGQETDSTVYFWDFGDGEKDTSDFRGVEHHYAVFKDYKVKLSTYFYINNQKRLFSFEKMVTLTPLQRLLIKGDTLVPKNTMISLTAEGADTFWWNIGTAASVIEPIITSDTLFSVKGVNQYGCESASVISIRVSPDTEEPKFWHEVVTFRPKTYVEDSGMIYIYDEKAFAWLISVSNGFNNADTSSFMEKVISIESDLDMGVYEWYPIGKPYFYGTLEGNNHTISNLFMNFNRVYYTGMISRNAGTIQNLTLKGTSFCFTDLRARVLGSICGSTSKMLRNCKNEGILKRSKDGLIGGITGHASGVVSNCVNVGVVYNGLKDNAAFESASYTGGIAGWSSATIINCLNMSEVVGGYYTGGIAGAIGGYGLNCANTGNVVGSVYVGGIAGYLSWDLANSYNIGRMINGGGLVGFQERRFITNCYNANTNVYCKESLVEKYNYVYWDSDLISLPNNTMNKLVSFSGIKNNWMLSVPVLSTSNLVEVLNSWVATTESTEYGSVYSDWEEDIVGINRGYPILKSLLPLMDTMIHTYAQNPIVYYESDTLLSLCPDVKYGGKIYTGEDTSHTQIVKIGDTIYTHALVRIKTFSLDEIVYNRPDLICVDMPLDFYCSGGEGYYWIMDNDTLSTEAHLNLTIPSFSPITLDHIVMKNGCPLYYSDTLTPSTEQILVNMTGWGDVIAIDNSDSLFVSYQWYRNDLPLQGEIKQFYYESGGLTTGTYTAKIFQQDSTYRNVCPLRITAEDVRSSAILSIYAFPNPGKYPAPIVLTINLENLSNALLVVINEAGRIVYENDMPSDRNELFLSPGSYIAYLHLDKKLPLSCKILIGR